MLCIAADALRALVVMPDVVTVVVNCGPTVVVVGVWWQAWIPGIPVETVETGMRLLCRNASVTPNLSGKSLAFVPG